ncbi:MAG: hypothetical protein IJY72_04820 [Akkermansia sp.]|nr:hypothetical protein [Akkermansia sp.]
MKNTKTQAQTLSLRWLYSKGYTISDAARAIGRSHQHVSQVLRGQRNSRTVTEALLALPAQQLQLRKRVVVN